MQKLANYHTHTYLCKHAVGRPVDYVKQAKKEGCLALGFSDHVPYPDYIPNHWPEIRMDYDQIPLYLQMVEEAKQNADFPVYLGFECEWDSDYSNYYKELKEKTKADYLVLGAHWLTESDTRTYAMGLETLEQVKKYIKQTIKAIESDTFTFIAHPDIFIGSLAKWDKEIISLSSDLIEAAISKNMPMEINAAGTTRNPIETEHGIRYPYPFQEFWELAASKGARIICNSDAHQPSDVLFGTKKAISFASMLGIKPLENLIL